MRRKNDDLFRILLESTHDAVLLMDTNIIVNCNNRAMELWGGTTQERLLGKHVWQLSPPRQPDGLDSKKGMLGKMEAAFSERSEPFTWQHLRFDGTRFETEVLLHAFRHHDRPFVLAVVRDTADHTQAGQTYEENRTGLYSIIQNLPYPVFVINRDHITLYWNKALEELTGIGSPEICDTSDHWKAFYEAKSPCLVDFLVDGVFETLSAYSQGNCSRSEGTDETYKVKAFFHRLPGGGKWLQLTGFILRDTQGHITGAVEILNDIHWLKRADAASSDIEERYRELLNHTREGVYRMTPKGQYTEVNPAFARMFGYDSPEEAKQSMVNLIPQICGDTAPVEAAAVEGHEDGAYEDFEVQVRRKDGISLSILNSVRVIRDAQGHTIGYDGIARDITEQRLTERALYQSERIKTTLMDALSELVIVLDKEFRVTGSNKALNRYFKLKPGELEGQPCYERLHQLAEPCVICPALKVMESGRPYMNENCAALGRRWSLKAYPLRDIQGNLDGVVNVMTDITEQKQTREELTHALTLLSNTLESTIQAMSVAVETRDPYTAGHQKRVADLACAIASEMGLSHKQINGIRMAAAIHDIGKICVPAEILTKPTSLTEIEFDLIKAHSQAGYEILKDIEFPWPIARVILEHHEKIDGSGYPNGLSGEQILIESRILTVADVVEAINSHRPYRPALGIETALAEIYSHKGTYYDPDVVDACLKLFAQKSFKLKPS